MRCFIGRCRRAADRSRPGSGASSYFNVLIGAGGSEFRDVNIMGVAHGTDRELVLLHKKAIDEHLKSIGMPVSYTNVFGADAAKSNRPRSLAYAEWCRSVGTRSGKMKN